MLLKETIIQVGLLITKRNGLLSVAMACRSISGNQ